MKRFFIFCTAYIIVASSIYAQELQIKSAIQKIEGNFSKQQSLKQPYLLSCYDKDGNMVLISNNSDNKWGRYKIDKKGHDIFAKSFIQGISIFGTPAKYNSYRVMKSINKDEGIFVTYAYKPENMVPHFGGTVSYYFIYKYNANGKVEKIDSIVTTNNTETQHQIISNSKGYIYLIDGAVIGLKGPYFLKKIYPKENRISKSNVFDAKEYVFFPKWNQFDTNHDNGNFSATFLNDENIMMLRRRNNLKGVFLRNLITCFVIDLKGSYTKEPFEIDLREYAYCKIENAYLPCKYYKQFIKTQEVAPTSMVKGGIYCYRNKEDNVIMAVTTLDEVDSLCIYLVKFDKEGNPVKPDKIENKTYSNISSVKEPRQIQNGIVLKYYWTTSDYNNPEMPKEWVFWAFDDDDNLFWEKQDLSFKRYW